MESKIELTKEELSKIIIHYYDIIIENLKDSPVNPDILLTMQRALLKDFNNSDNIDNKLKKSLALFDLNILVHNAKEMKFENKDKEGGE